MRIGELAQITGISERMLRYYEQEGLLQPVRKASGYREYDASQIKAAQRIRMLTIAGLKIETIRVLLPCMLDNEPLFYPCPAVQAALRKELSKLDEKLRELSHSREIIACFLHSIGSNSCIQTDLDATDQDT